ncbi:MAG: oligopeptide/dipeptide ABC transporter ATP-binding protein [Cognatishimia sp.]
MTVPLIELRNIRKTFQVRRGMFKPSQQLVAVNNLSLCLDKGQTLGLVGESGCGKSTAINMMLGLMAPDSGEVLIDGRNISQMPMQDRVRMIQPVFQDPYSSLNPVRKIRDLVSQPLRLHGGENIDAKTTDMLDRVGFPNRLADAYPSDLSGGQRQRVAIARALILEPKVLICDEPTSALDVSVQAQVINLLLSLRRELDLTMVFVSHNLAVVEHVADRVIVMYLGEVVEEAGVDALFDAPQHPYSAALLAATLIPEPGLGLPAPKLGSAAADPFASPTGCAFAPRCANAVPACDKAKPKLRRRNQSAVMCDRVGAI